MISAVHGDGIPQRHPWPTHDEVHVWRASISGASGQLAGLEAVLSDPERNRADRFVRHHDRLRFVTAHGMLRFLLGQYLSMDPAALTFGVSSRGKPELAGGDGPRRLTFNLAHSGEMIVCAFAAGRRIGVDVEVLRDDVDVLEIADGQFSPMEAASLRAMQPAERLPAFFRCWTRKEAYVKARGEGLGFPLNQFAVSFLPGDPPAFQWFADDVTEIERWSMADVPLADGYAGAVVVEGKRMDLICRNWESATEAAARQTASAPKPAVSHPEPDH